jgi:hypothetical protein
VRVERLQAISEADAKAEGVQKPMAVCEDDPSTYVDAYADLWDSINAPRAPSHIRRRRVKGKPTERYDAAHPAPAPAPNSWQANPWVWVVEFKRAEAA